MAFSQKNRRDEQKTQVATTNTTTIGDVGITGEQARDVLVAFSNNLSQAFAGITATAQTGIAATAAAARPSDLEMGAEANHGALSLDRGWAFAALALVGLVAIWNWMGKS